ncbi:WhiB family transcriptional regulator [Mycobacterium sp. CnD-18-1]|uniref:WhiB family transcriptional regulator n=1 Tax=Mycobacterium sp. CnD-18-1 TaxID=2917744 RepID=UPI001EF25321|nr:WhiB family transcriptional regulator [Mycobacterium sp. CnD-18-1]MCG7607182.1 WhiB family transcriptional regulator [Mycobacterium sp. CnD-18-1]
MIIGSLHGIRRPPRERGLCSKISDPDTFFSTDISDIKEAKLMCAACPIRKSCLERALQGSSPGILGGLSWDERRRVKQGRRRNAEPKLCAQCARPFMPRGERAVLRLDLLDGLERQKESADSPKFPGFSAIEC